MRAGCALVSVWFLHATLLHLLERGSKLRDWQADLYSTSGLTMADRYKDVLTALPYSLIHLTGDFPIYRYGPASYPVLILGFSLGMCVFGAFIGVFTASYVVLVSSEKARERDRLDKERRDKLLIATLRLQLAVRRSQAHFRSLSPDERRAVRDKVSQQLSWRMRLLPVIEGANACGRRLEVVLGATLAIDILNTLIATIPLGAAPPGIARGRHLLELVLDATFVIEYVLRISTRRDKSAHALSGRRVFDLACLVPGPWRAACVFAGRGWSSAEALRSEETVDLVCTALLIFRILRVTSFGRYRRKWLAVVAAVTRSMRYLLVLAYDALCTWIYISALFHWTESYYRGPCRYQMSSILNAMYWSSMFVVGEWPMADFTQGAGSRVCIFTILFGVMVFAVPFGVLVEAVQEGLAGITKEESSENQRDAAQRFVQPAKPSGRRTVRRSVFLESGPGVAAMPRPS